MLILAIELREDVVAELLVNLLGDATGPTDDLVIDKLDSLVELFSLFTLSPKCCKFGVKSGELW
jgi:hypothetical protein